MKEILTETRITGTSFIGYKRGKKNSYSFSSRNQQKGTDFPEVFFSASGQEVKQAAQLAENAFQQLKKISHNKRSSFLDALAVNLERQKTPILERIHFETALGYQRLEGEFARTLNQIRLFSSFIRNGSFTEPSIDIAYHADKQIKYNIRKIQVPIGPVAVFGAGNFPLAFSTVGGDTVSAWAAGCPVIVKAHNGHPGSSAIIAGIVNETIKEQEMPEGFFSLLFDKKNRVGLTLVQHPSIKAIGFTGSFSGGMALFGAAVKRKEPIPVFAEMGSVNPVFLFPKALSLRPLEIAAQFAASITQSCGQLCTKPGLFIAEKGDALDKFMEALKKELSAYGLQPMLNQTTLDRFNRNILKTVTANKNLSSFEFCNKSFRGKCAQTILAIADASAFLSDKTLQQEIFGPYALIVSCRDKKEVHQVLNSLEGQLTASIIAEPDESKEEQGFIQQITEKAGRIIFNGIPTGVEVCPSIHHGGPFPSATFSQHTSVGSDSIKRFLRPVCYQNWNDPLLPDELKDSNPTKISRRVNGKFTMEPI